MGMQSQYEPSEEAKQDISRCFRKALVVGVLGLAGAITYDYSTREGSKPQEQRHKQGQRAPFEPVKDILIRDKKGINDKVEQPKKNLEEKVERVNRLELVRQGKLDAKQYLEGILDNMPEYQQAKKDGVIKGFLYNPSYLEVENVTRDLFQDDSTLFEESMNSYKELVENPHEVTILPFSSSLFGTHVPQYLLCEPVFLKSSLLRTSEDVRLLFLDWIAWAKDQYSDIAIDGEYPSYRKSSSGTVGESFAVSLLSLRSLHTALEATRSDLSASSSFLEVISRDYIQAQEKLKLEARTDKEKKILSAQLSKISDVSVVFPSKYTMEIIYTRGTDVTKRKIIIGTGDSPSF